jgi:hypothetical protein
MDANYELDIAAGSIEISDPTYGASSRRRGPDITTQFYNMYGNNHGYGYGYGKGYTFSAHSGPKAKAPRRRPGDKRENDRERQERGVWSRMIRAVTCG